MCDRLGNPLPDAGEIAGTAMCPSNSGFSFGTIPRLVIPTGTLRPPMIGGKNT
jgi:hypothetical protein